MYAEAEPLSKRALDIWEKGFGRDDPMVIFALKSYVDLLRRMGRDAEAESYEVRIKPNQPNSSGANPVN